MAKRNACGLEKLNWEDSSLTATDEMVTPCNMFGYALFSSVEMKINGETITFNQKHYPWMSYVLQMLHLSTVQRKQYLEACLYYPDTPELFERPIDNDGAIKRYAQIVRSTKTDLYMPIITDSQLMPKFLPPKTRVEFEFSRSPVALLLQHGEDKKYRIRINEFKLYVAKSKLTRQALELQDRVLTKSGAHFPAARYKLYTLSVNKGLQSVDWTAFDGRLPRRIYIWGTSQEAYMGSAAKNLFSFNLPDMDSFTLFVNDDRYPCNVAVSCKKNNIRALYNTLYALNYKENNIGLARDAFNGGYQIFCADLRCDHSSDCNYLSNPADGQLRISIDFSKELPHAVVIFAMGEFTSELKIDRNREVSWVKNA